MKQRVGWSKAYTASFAISKLCLRQSNAFDKSVSSIPSAPLLSKFFYHKKKAILSAVTLSVSTLMFGENLIKITIHLIKHTPSINFGENGKDTNGTIIFDIKLSLLFMNGYNASLFQFWGKNWTEQWVIEVMMYKVWFYYFHGDAIFLTCFFFISKFCSVL